MHTDAFNGDADGGGAATGRGADSPPPAHAGRGGT